MSADYKDLIPILRICWKDALRNPLEFAREFHQLGGELLLVDEIHKYPDWSVHVKAIYDSLPDLKIVFSGSSLLQITKQKADLSRRAIIFNLHGLSLREYINFSHGKAYPVCSLEEILANHQEIAATICQEIKPLREFKHYLQGGITPSFLREKNSTHSKSAK